MCSKYLNTLVNQLHFFFWHKITIKGNSIKSCLCWLLNYFSMVDSTFNWTREKKKKVHIYPPLSISITLMCLCVGLRWGCTGIALSLWCVCEWVCGCLGGGSGVAKIIKSFGLDILSIIPKVENSKKYN